MDVSDCTKPAAEGISPRFLEFVRAMSRTLDEAAGDEPRILENGAPLVAELVSHDDWLPARLALPIPGSYGQYLLYRDPARRFTTVAFVWDGGASTPIHDHTVWGLVGVLRGAEVSERFSYRDGALVSRGTARLGSGEVDRVSPRVGDIHRVRNAFADQPSISIHVYGADLCTVKRHTYCDRTGRIEIITSKPYDNAEPLLVKA
ncbi:MAG: cysteine dioxygenase [Candidatus Eremiobacteraeota bacterium]|nr:cysteine dioxygenase [Candidatus Eremiobacteraeota bacterium]MBV9646838.1 cysteine dioxygenase [Candidatus Eremiobacteraeota bacterium]